MAFIHIVLTKTTFFDVHVYTQFVFQDKEAW